MAATKLAFANLPLRVVHGFFSLVRDTERRSATPGELPEGDANSEYALDDLNSFVDDVEESVLDCDCCKPGYFVFISLFNRLCLVTASLALQ